MQRKNSFCMFGDFCPTRKLSTQLETSTLPMKGCKLFTYSRHLSNWGFLPCHNYCDTGHPFIMIISEDTWHSHLLPTCVNDLGLSRLGFKHPSFHLRGERSNTQRHHRCSIHSKHVVDRILIKELLAIIHWSISLCKETTGTI